MSRVASIVLGALATAAAVWVTYLVVDPAALKDAQAALLLLPALPAGAFAGEALAVALSKNELERRSGPSTLIRGGVATLLIVAFFVWLGSLNSRDGVPRLLSPWCLIPMIVGFAQLSLGLSMRFRQR